MDWIQFFIIVALLLWIVWRLPPPNLAVRPHAPPVRATKPDRVCPEWRLGRGDRGEVGRLPDSQDFCEQGCALECPHSRVRAINVPLPRRGEGRFSHYRRDVFLPLLFTSPERIELEPFCGRERSGSPRAKSRAEHGTWRVVGLMVRPERIELPTSWFVAKLLRQAGIDVQDQLVLA